MKVLYTMVLTDWFCFRFRPLVRPSKLYVCISMALCLVLCCLIVFFLFPRSVLLIPFSVQSVMVFFTADSVRLEVTVSTASASRHQV